MKQTISHSENETRKLAKRLAKKITHGVIALIGPLGAGKTTFVQGFAKGLRIKEKIISPTFILIRQHRVPKTKEFLYHIDLYRLGNKRELKDIGLEEILNDPSNIVLIEWAEKATKFLSKNSIKIYFEIVDENTRKIKVLRLPS